jgi:hypothetical protein
MHNEPSVRFTCASLRFFAALALISTFGVAAQANAQKLITFDAPNSSQQPYLGTAAAGINVWGTIVGDVTDDAGGVHGFARTAAGEFTEFDAPGANPAPGAPCLYYAGGTCPTAINDAGVIVGYVGDVNGVFHGFVRSPDGKITAFDAPGAGTGAGLGTFAFGVNDFGTATGYFVDSSGEGHGFLRGAGGKIQTFDYTGGGAAGYLGIYPESINNAGAVAGWETDGSGFSHGFVRSLEGKITIFDPSGSAGSCCGLDYAYINDFGVVAGDYWQGAGNVSYGFERGLDGKIAEFQVPNAGTDPFDGAYVTAVNLEGTTVGYVTDENVENHCFVRYANGNATVFDVPGQEAVPGSDFGSAAYAINALGVVAGRWHDTNLVLHAFVRVP